MKVVVVCDGVNSQARFLLTGQIKKPAEADYSIHRAVMNSDSVREDKQCRRKRGFLRKAIMSRL